MYLTFARYSSTKANIATMKVIAHIDRTPISSIITLDNSEQNAKPRLLAARIKELAEPIFASPSNFPRNT
ncbi:MAG: hypothetical protein ACK5LT_11785 [Lachnospirales bacterium]